MSLPVSTIPDPFIKISLPPYDTDWSMPQYLLDGYVFVTGTYSSGPVVFDVSGAPHDNSP